MQVRLTGVAATTTQGRLPMVTLFVVTLAIVSASENPEPVTVSCVPPARDPVVGVKRVLAGGEGTKQQRGGGAKVLVLALSSSLVESRRPL